MSKASLVRVALTSATSALLAAGCGNAAPAAADAAALMCSPSALSCLGDGGGPGNGKVRLKISFEKQAPQEFLDRIAVCGLAVVGEFGDILDQDSLPCARCSIRGHDLGTVEWATSHPGRVRFIVTVNDLANDPERSLGKGESDLLQVVAGEVVLGSVEVRLSPNWTEIGANTGLCPAR